MDNTYIKLWRSILESWVFANPAYLKLWVYILCEANFAKRHIEYRIPTGGTVTVTLQPGQCIFGARKWADILGISKSRLDRMMRELESRDMLGRRPGRHFTIVSICNWSTYQGEEGDAGTPGGTPVGRQWDASGTIHKKDKKVPGYTTLARPTLDEVAAYCRERKNSVDPEAWIDYYTSNGWKVGRNPMKDWRAAVRTWERKRKESAGGRSQEQDRILAMRRGSHDPTPEEVCEVMGWTLEKPGDE